MLGASVCELYLLIKSLIKATAIKLYEVSRGPAGSPILQYT